MARDSGFNVFGEVIINCVYRVFRKQRDAFGDGTPNRPGGMQYGNGSLILFNDNLRACAHVGQERRNVGGGGLFFGNVDHVPRHVLIIHRCRLCPTHG